MLARSRLCCVMFGFVTLGFDRLSWDRLCYVRLGLVRFVWLTIGYVRFR
jgi:hypothetical protein